MPLKCHIYMPHYQINSCASNGEVCQYKCHIRSHCDQNWGLKKGLQTRHLDAQSVIAYTDIPNQLKHLCDSHIDNIWEIVHTIYVHVYNTNIGRVVSREQI